MSIPGGSSEQGGGSSAEGQFPEGALPTFDVLTLFDESRQMLHGWLHSVEVDMESIDEVAERAGEYIESASMAFGELGAHFRSTQEDDEEAQSILATMWEEDDAERMMLFQNMTDCADCYTGENSEQIANNIRIAYLQAEHQKVDIAAALQGAYMGVAAQEVGALLGHLAKGNLQFHEDDMLAAEQGGVTQPTDPSVRFEVTVPAVAEKVVGYTLDVAKIALGAGIALWAYRKYYDRG